MNGVKPTFSLALVALMLFSCSRDGAQSNGDFERLTAYIYLVEESNRIGIKEFILANHEYKNEKTQLIQDILILYDILDLGVSALLDDAGGYNTKGELINGKKKGVVSTTFERLNLFDEVGLRMKEIESESSNTPEHVERIKSAVYLVTNSWKSYDLASMTVAEAYLGLIAVQHKLLSEELVIYSEIK